MYVQGGGVAAAVLGAGPLAGTTPYIKINRVVNEEEIEDPDEYDDILSDMKDGMPPSIHPRVSNMCVSGVVCDGSALHSLIALQGAGRTALSRTPSSSPRNSR